MSTESEAVELVRAIERMAEAIPSLDNLHGSIEDIAMRSFKAEREAERLLRRTISADALERLAKVLLDMHPSLVESDDDPMCRSFIQAVFADARSQKEGDQ